MNGIELDNSCLSKIAGRKFLCTCFYFMSSLNKLCHSTEFWIQRHYQIFYKGEKEEGWQCRWFRSLICLTHSSHSPLLAPIPWHKEIIFPFLLHWKSDNTFAFRTTVYQTPSFIFTVTQLFHENSAWNKNMHKKDF